ncbi:MAG: hypothetical protein ABFD50_18350 [Smithella sp.]
MATNTSVTYLSETLVGGPIVTDQVALAADTYYKGMILTYDARANNWAYDAAPAAADTGVAVYMGDGSARTLSSTGYDTVIKAGELMLGGFVDDSGTAVTLDEDIISILGTFGIHVRRK